MTDSARSRAPLGHPRRVQGLGVAFACTILLALAVGPAAAAAAEHKFLAQCGKTGSEADNTSLPRGIATDPKTGHVFVADQLNRRIDEFTPLCQFVKAFGWDVAPGGVDEEQEVRVKAAAGQFRLEFGAEFTSDLPFNATEAEVEAALNGLASIGSGGGHAHVEEVRGAINGKSPFIYVVRFEGSLAHTDVAQLTASNGTTPLSGGQPTGLEARTRANGTPGGTGLEACTKASKCKEGDQGGGTGQLTTPLGLAVDSSGAPAPTSSRRSRSKRPAASSR